jgi:exportin-1
VIFRADDTLSPLPHTKAHWKFLKTVVNKLFEFMHETHPGVQDMACDTFLKIAQKCRRKFVVREVGETYIFVEEILNTLPQIISDLEPQQIQTFYEAVGYMIHAHTDPVARKNLVIKFMDLPTQTVRNRRRAAHRHSRQF